MQRPVVVQLSDIADEHIDIWHQFKARWKLSLAEYTTFAREMGTYRRNAVLNTYSFDQGNLLPGSKPILSRYFRLDIFWTFHPNCF